MGGSDSRELPKSNVLTSEEMKEVTELFQDAKRSGDLQEHFQSVFKIKNDVVLSHRMYDFVRSNMNADSDLKGFVKSFEILIHGRTSDSFETQKPLVRLFRILKLEEKIESFEVLTHCLLAIIDSAMHPLLQIDLEARDINEFSSKISSKYPVLDMLLKQFLKKRLSGQSLSILDPPDSSILSEYFPVLSLTSPHFLFIERMHKLYNSSNDGMGFQHLAKCIRGYTGPILFLFRLSNSSVIGGFIGGNLKDNGKYSGSYDSFLFSTIDYFRIIRPQNSNDNYVYFNSKIRKNSRHPVGLGFGGTLNGDFKLWIDKHIEDRSYSFKYCSTYSHEDLVNTFDDKVMLGVFHIEAWGCGTDSDLEAQAKNWEREDQEAYSHRKVDKMKMLESEFDKEFFFGNLFKHNENKQERE